MLTFISKGKNVFSKLINKNSFRFLKFSTLNKSSEVDEVEELNKRIRNLTGSSTRDSNNQLNKSSFSFDLNKIKGGSATLPPRKEFTEEEEKRLKSKISKVSEAQRVTIQKNEDAQNYNLKLQTEQEADSILDAIFKKGTNQNFIKKLDKIYEIVNEDSISSLAKKEKNKYGDLDIEEKDLSDIEESIDLEQIEKFFELKKSEEEFVLNKSKSKPRTIEDYIEKNKAEKKLSSNNSQNTIYSHNSNNVQKAPEINLNKSNYKVDSLDLNKLKIPVQKDNTNLNTNNTKYIHKVDINDTPKPNITPNPNPIIAKSEAKPSNFTPTPQLNKITPNLTTPPTINTIKVNKQIKDLTLDLNENISSNLNPGQEDEFLKFFSKIKSENKQQKTTPKIPPKKTNFNLEYFKSLKEKALKDFYIQDNFTSKEFSSLSEIFNYIHQATLVKKEMRSKNSQTYFKQVPHPDMYQHITSNYHIKISNDVVSVRLFKSTIFEIDRRRLDIITSKIIASKEKTVNIIYQCKKFIKGNEGVAVFSLFANEEHLGSLLLNFGPIGNVNFLNLYSSLLSLILVELIQIGCERTSVLLNFNLVFAKKFDVETKLSVKSMKKEINMLSNLIETKLIKFRSSTPSVNSEFDEDGKIKDTSYISKIPNIKFYNYPSLMRKSFNQYFSGAAKLEKGQLNFKI